VRLNQAGLGESWGSKFTSEQATHEEPYSVSTADLRTCATVRTSKTAESKCTSQKTTALRAQTSSRTHQLDGAPNEKEGDDDRRGDEHDGQ
jgi:hypothetical protein